MRLLTFLFLILSFSILGCRTQKAATNNYLQNVADTTGDPVNQVQFVIQKGDLLSIRVYSAALGLNPQADAPYNLPSDAAGFTVDVEGNIDYPQLGVLHVEGLTREQLSEMIKKRLEGQLTNPSVIVRFLNYRVTVLGEVAGPSTFTIPTERITILEALGLAGDITEFGRKDNIKVIREVNGQREIGSIDVTSKEMFSSPYYHLKQNDVVLVDATDKKRRQQEQTTLVQNIGIASSIITAIALILNIIK